VALFKVHFQVVVCETNRGVEWMPLEFCRA